MERLANVRDSGLLLIGGFMLACGTPDPGKHLRIEAANTAPIGVELTAVVLFELQACDGAAEDGGACLNRIDVAAETFEVVADGANATVVRSELDYCETECVVAAYVKGLAEGAARLSVSINGAGPAEFEIDIGVVRSSFVEPNDVIRSLNETFFEQHYTTAIASTFAESALILEQKHYSTGAVDGEPPAESFALRGASAWVPRGDLASLDPEELENPSKFAVLDVGAELGTFEIATEMGGSLTLAIIDRAGVASAEIVDGLGYRSLGESLTLAEGGSKIVRVVPFDAQQQMIFGAGQKPGYTTGDDVIEVVSIPPDHPFLLYPISAKAVGSTTLEFSFDDVVASIPVVVE